LPGAGLPESEPSDTGLPESRLPEIGLPEIGLPEIGRQTLSRGRGVGRHRDTRVRELKNV